jgi:hypothetical protein
MQWTFYFLNVTFVCKPRADISSTFFKYGEWKPNISCNILNKNALSLTQSKIKQWWKLCCLLSFKKWRVDGSCQLKYCPCILKILFYSKTRFLWRNNACVRDNQQPLVHLHGQARITLLQIQFTNSDPETRNFFSH